MAISFAHDKASKDAISDMKMFFKTEIKELPKNDLELITNSVQEALNKAVAKK